MKKLLIFIFLLFFLLISFSYGFNYCGNLNAGDSININESFVFSGLVYIDVYDNTFFSLESSCSVSAGFDELSVYYFSVPTTVYCCSNAGFDESSCNFINLNSCSLGGSSVSSDITVYYNNGQTTSISCNGDNIITIDGLSSMSSISTFTPYFNINYTDQNNQVLTDSYSNSILYLSGGQFLKTYTGGSINDWILNLVTSEDTVFTGYLSTFDVTGNITEIDTGNVFNNFAENSLTVLLSNIPNYIQYVIMFALLLFVLGIFRKLRK